MINKVILVGHLGNDPDLRYTQGQTPVANFSLATSETIVKDNGDKDTRTEWHKIVVWGKQAEHCSKYLQKGSKIFLEGKITTRKWEDKEGNTRYSTEIVALPYGVRFLDSKDDADRRSSSRPPQESQQSNQQQKQTNKQAAPSEDPYNFGVGSTDDIPF